MRHVMDNDMVAHVWAAQSQDDARNPQRNFYFEGDTIYSYGRHFPIARFVDGKRAVLFTTRTYSNTTAGHIHTVRRALHGLNLPVFHIEHPGDKPRSSDVKRDYEQRIDTAMEQAARARLKSVALMEQAQNLAREANEFAEFFGWEWRLPVPELSEEKIKAARKAVRESNAKRRKENEERAERYRKEAEERAARDAVTREAWLRGENVRYPGSRLGQRAGGHAAPRSWRYGADLAQCRDPGVSREAPVADHPEASDRRHYLPAQRSLASRWSVRRRAHRSER
jgi:hypothetical protein